MKPIRTTAVGGSASSVPGPLPLRDRISPELPTASLRAELTSKTAEVMNLHAQVGGFTVPNSTRYPWQWLWDSCFHSIIWLALGELDRSIIELRTTLQPQDESGFVPHIRYHTTNPHREFWGRQATSSITQPPMFGHVIAEVHRQGATVPAELVDRAGRGLSFLLRQRRRVDGLVTVVHPWETGADNSPRWDHWCGEPFSIPHWRTVKGDLMGAVERSASGAPVGSRAFSVAPASFNALIAFNALELADITGDDRLIDDAGELVGLLDQRWDDETGTWTDAGDAARTSGRVRTCDALLPLLVSERPDAVAMTTSQLVDADAFAGAFGLLGVHRHEPLFHPQGYWRGGSWPQLAYLLWVAAHRRHRYELAESLRRTTWSGAVQSDFAEFWDPDDGTGLGAIPQSWTGLVIAMSDLGDPHPDRS